MNYAGPQTNRPMPWFSLFSSIYCAIVLGGITLGILTQVYLAIVVSRAGKAMEDSMKQSAEQMKADAEWQKAMEGLRAKEDSRKGR